MILGFTGTRKGLTPAQHATLPGVLATLPERVLHGGAEGSDEQFHNYLVSLYKVGHGCMIEILLGKAHRYAFWVSPNRPCVAFSVHRMSPPLERNRIIAARCDHLLACPAEAMEQLRSGTWATVRYARAAGKPITIIASDGTVREERR